MVCNYLKNFTLILISVLLLSLVLFNKSSTMVWAAIAKPPLLLDKDSNIHYIGVFKSDSSNEKPKKQTINVRVTIKNKPLYLILTSYESVHWNIIADKGVIYDKVFISGYNKQSYSGIPSNVKVMCTSREEINGTYLTKEIENKEDYLELIEEIRRITMEYPSTVQSPPFKDSFIVDGIRTIHFQKYKNIPGPAKFIIHSNTNKNMIIDSSSGVTKPFYDNTSSKGSLTITSAGNPTHHRYISTKYFQTGKWYAELQLNKTSGYPWTDFGITSFSCDSFLSSDRCAIGSRDIFSKKNNTNNFKEGAVYGIAMDLDHSKVYFSENGKWVVGDPNTNTGGINILPYKDYSIGVEIFNYNNISDSFTGNFGATSFKYKIPKGYKPYNDGE